MKLNKHRKIGYTCAYTPLPLIDAAGYTPFRIFPMAESPDQSGQLLHDNLCPHVKRVLDRAMDNDLPELEGLVFMNSCDTMRRMADAWKKVRPNDKVLLIDLPSTRDPLSYTFLSEELSFLWKKLNQWSDSQYETEKIIESIDLYNQICHLLSSIQEHIQHKRISGGYARLQEIYNQVSCIRLESAISFLKEIIASVDHQNEKENKAPKIFLFGNMLPDPEAYTMIENCGAVISGDDFCSGSRMFHRISISSQATIFSDLSRSLLNRPLCARTFDANQPGKLAADILEMAQKSGANGVIGHVLKFCDPYLDRIAMIRATFKTANMHFLLIEGDCTLRTIGQQKTRIEAFIEMLR